MRVCSSSLSDPDCNQNCSLALRSSSLLSFSLPKEFLVAATDRPKPKADKTARRPFAGVALLLFDSSHEDIGDGSRNNFSGLILFTMSVQLLFLFCWTSGWRAFYSSLNCVLDIDQITGTLISNILEICEMLPRVLAVSGWKNLRCHSFRLRTKSVSGPDWS